MDGVQPEKVGSGRLRPVAWLPTAGCRLPIQYDPAMLLDTRRRFMAHFASIGLGTTLVPGVLWARMQDAGTQTVTLAMVTDALQLSGIELSEEDRKAMVEARQPEPDPVQGTARGPHPERRLAAVPLQPRRAGHDGGQDAAAVPDQQAAGAEAARAIWRTWRSGRCAISRS